MNYVNPDFILKSGNPYVNGYLNNKKTPGNGPRKEVEQFQNFASLALERHLEEKDTITEDTAVKTDESGLVDETESLIFTNEQGAKILMLKTPFGVRYIKLADEHPLATTQITDEIIDDAEINDDVNPLFNDTMDTKG